MEVTYTNNGKQAYFNGKKYTRDDKRGYYRRTENGTSSYLHKMVYITHNGAIPDGYHVHHKDGNKSNNEIDNLELLSEFSHLSYHGLHVSKERAAARKENLIKNVMPKAVQWHKSKAGSEWHKQHFEASRDKLFKQLEFTCLVCGKKFITWANGQNKFCSNNCKSKHRRLTGIDNVERICPVCGRTFIIGKYSTTKTCGKECGRKLHSIHSGAKPQEVAR